eukprot:64605-Amphidinium_carterae.1
MHEMLQHPYYDAMQRTLDDVEMEMTEYLNMKQYLQYLSYQRTLKHLQRIKSINESTLRSSQKPSTITAESYSTS